jgi:RNA polymerase sigma factor (sigma-70 family)
MNLRLGCDIISWSMPGRCSLGRPLVGFAPIDLQRDGAVADDSVIELVERFQQGDPRAADELFARYVDRLVALARSRLSPKLARKVDPEDLVQSVYGSFFVGAREGQFTIEEGKELWSLLAAITINKVHRQVERHTAAKRNVNLEVSVAGSGAGSFLARPEKIAEEPSPPEAAELAEGIEQLMSGLSTLHRRMLQLRLQGHTLVEIAEETSRSERTVRRAMDKIKATLEELAADSLSD